MIKRLTSQFRRVQIFGLTLVLLVLPLGCFSQPDFGIKLLADPPDVAQCSPDSLPPSRSTFTVKDGPAVKIAAEISKDAGKVIASGSGNPNRTVFIFEERHDLPIGQMEIAMMLVRLQKSYGLRQVSLEGAIAGKDDLSAKWFHDLTGPEEANRVGQRVTLKLMREGEISSGEFIALTLPSIQVKGNERENEYNVEPSKKNSVLLYLDAIAEQSLSNTDRRQINELAQAKKINEALDVLFSKDQWARERYQKLYVTQTASIEESLVILREVEAKARSLNIQLETADQKGLEQDRIFYQTASKRSCTMVGNTLAMMETGGNSPIALIVGAAHTPKVVELIKAANLSYVVISPLSLINPPQNGRMTGEMFARKNVGKSIDYNGKLGALLDGRRKPRPVESKAWFRSKAEIYYSLGIITAAAAKNQPITSEALKTKLQSLHYTKIDWSSLKVNHIKNGAEVMFKVSAQIDDSNPGRTTDLWVKGWHQPPPPPIGPGNKTYDIPDPDDESDLEKLIQDALDEERKGPSDEKVVVQISTTTRAAFATSPNILESVAVGK